MYLPEDAELTLKSLAQCWTERLRLKSRKLLISQSEWFAEPKWIISGCNKNARAFWKEPLIWSVQEADEDIEGKEELYKKNRGHNLTI